MNGSTKIQPGHRERRAVVYLRQSSPKQVLHNRESAANQRALREVLLELGWARSQIQVIDEDQARSARHVCGRDGFQKLVADVSLRQVGIIVGYEVSRLSRNCADWHRLLELCALCRTPDHAISRPDRSPG
jgi:DNA invertase Pin-like site-specific DNA recombinase